MDYNEQIKRHQIIRDFNKSVFADESLVEEEDLKPYSLEDDYSFFVADNKYVQYSFDNNDQNETTLSCIVKIVATYTNHQLTIKPEIDILSEHLVLIDYINKFSKLFAVTFFDQFEYQRTIGVSSFLKISKSLNGYSYNINLMHRTNTFKSVIVTGGGAGVLNIDFKNGVVGGSFLPVVKTSLDYTYDIEVVDFNDHEHLQQLIRLAEMSTI